MAVFISSIIWWQIMLLAQIIFVGAIGSDPVGDPNRNRWKIPGFGWLGAGSAAAVADQEEKNAPQSLVENVVKAKRISDSPKGQDHLLTDHVAAEHLGLARSCSDLYKDCPVAQRFPSGSDAVNNPEDIISDGSESKNEKRREAGASKLRDTTPGNSASASTSSSSKSRKGSSPSSATRVAEPKESRKVQAAANKGGAIGVELAESGEVSGSSSGRSHKNSKRLQDGKRMQDGDTRIRAAERKHQPRSLSIDDEPLIAVDDSRLYDDLPPPPPPAYPPPDISSDELAAELAAHYESKRQTAAGESGSGSADASVSGENGSASFSDQDEEHDVLASYVKRVTPDNRVASGQPPRPPGNPLGRPFSTLASAHTTAEDGGGGAFASASPLPPIMKKPRTPANVLESLKLENNRLTLDATWTSGITDAGGQSTIFKLSDSYGYEFALKVYNKRDDKIHSAVRPGAISDRSKQLMATAYYHDVYVPVSVGDNPPHMNVPIAYRAGTLLQSLPEFTQRHRNFPADNWGDGLPALNKEDWIDQVEAAIARSDTFKRGFITKNDEAAIARNFEQAIGGSEAFKRGCWTSAAEFWAFPMVLYEFAQHGDVRSVLVEHRRFSMRNAKQVLDLGTQMLRALAHMRANDWSHRDIKADNILVFAPSDYRLTDFGLSASINRPHDSGRVGSWPNLPPEFWLGQKMDTSRDLFALGTVMYNVVGEMNFWSDGAIKRLQQHARNKDAYAVMKEIADQFQFLWKFIDKRLFHEHLGVADATPLERAKIKLLFRRLLARLPANRGTAQGILDEMDEMDHTFEEYEKIYPSKAPQAKPSQPVAAEEDLGMRGRNPRADPVEIAHFPGPLGPPLVVSTQAGAADQEAYPVSEEIRLDSASAAASEATVSTASSVSESVPSEPRIRQIPLPTDPHQIQQVQAQFAQTAHEAEQRRRRGQRRGNKFTRPAPPSEEPGPLKKIANLFWSEDKN